MSNEKWYAPVAKVVDYFKLRGSWGQTGNQNIGDLMFLSPITTKEYTTTSATNMEQLHRAVTMAPTRAGWQTPT